MLMATVRTPLAHRFAHADFGEFFGAGQRFVYKIERLLPFSRPQRTGNQSYQTLFRTLPLLLLPREFIVSLGGPGVSTPKLIILPPLCKRTRKVAMTAMTDDSAISTTEAPKSPKERAVEAGTYVKDTASKIIHQAEKGPLPLRVVAFLGGVAMIAASIIDAFHGVWHGDVIHIMVAVYVCIFGAMICILEGAEFLPSWIIAIQATLHDQARFLRFRWGRGVFFFFAGSLQFSHWSLLNIIVGGIMMVLGLISIGTGRRAAGKLGELRKSIPDENALQRNFTAHDSLNGFLSFDDFISMVGSLGLELGQNEMEVAFAAIDIDNDGQISYDDFKMWWHEENIKYF